MNTKNNQRFRNMDRKIKATVLELLKEMDFNKITVKMICKKAEGNRSTFYAHYADIYDILEQMEEHLNEELLESYPAWRSTDTDIFFSGHLFLFYAILKNIAIFIKSCSNSAKFFSKAGT